MVWSDEGCAVWSERDTGSIPARRGLGMKEVLRRNLTSLLLVVEQGETGVGVGSVPLHRAPIGTTPRLLTHN